MKLSHSDIISILSAYINDADKYSYDDIKKRHLSQPSTHNFALSFELKKDHYIILRDNSAFDDLNYLENEINKLNDKKLKINLLKNDLSNLTTYALFYKGKEYYLAKLQKTTKRLDTYLYEHYKEISRSRWQKYIKDSRVSINGKTITTPSYEIDDRAIIDIKLPEEKKFEKEKLDILYLDDNVIVINKPAGILTHAKGTESDEFTVADFFKRYSTYALDTNRAGIVHRLDRDTSGVIIGARNNETANLLKKQFAKRLTKKTYIAITTGIPKLEKARIDLPIARNPKKPATFKISSNGKVAITDYKVLKINENYALIELMPKTGRTHQLRVHLNYINCSILGDKVYGAKKADRMYLHAEKLEITIPNKGRITFEAKLPKEFKNIFKK
ncbi:RluA family pseudouridine synthase [TM7 phylum sp. oral taxon 350]|nr:RluA family pseudouridine synthase [TM7 phylum sp. oral taxon 350]